jgi:histone H3/H4
LESIKFNKESQRLVGYALEQLLTLFFHRGQLAASHRKRKSVQACDLKLGQTLSDESAVLKSLQET